MLGIEDKWLAPAYRLGITGMWLCVVYGRLDWKRGEAESPQEVIRWAAEENKLEEKL